jgi:hypothetical protein
MGAAREAAIDPSQKKCEKHEACQARNNPPYGLIQAKLGPKGKATGNLGNGCA